MHQDACIANDHACMTECCSGCGGGDVTVAIEVETGRKVVFAVVLKDAWYDWFVGSRFRLL